MSQENVEIVQQGYMDVNAFMQGNLADGSLEQLLDPQIEWDWNLSAARPPGTPERVQGSGELLAFLERVRDEWSDVAVEPLEFVDGSDGRVLVCARQFRRLSDEAALDTLDVFTSGRFDKEGPRDWRSSSTVPRPSKPPGSRSGRLGPCRVGARYGNPTEAKRWL